MIAMRAGAGVLAFALFAGAVGLHLLHDRLGPLPLPASSEDVMYVRSPAVVTRAALSFDGLASDVYWMRAIQVYGGTKRSTDPNKSYAQLYPLLDLATSLDPYFETAYRFGAIFLSEPYPDGPGRPDQAIALLDKGLAAEPNHWQYAQDIGFVHYWWRHDYKAAADWFLKAQQIGGPAWLTPLAAVTLAQGGNRASSRQLWTQLTSSDLAWLRDVARRRLTQLDAMDQIDALRLVAGRYEQRSGVRVTSWQQLVAAGQLRRMPVDPAGYPYLLDGQRAIITLDPRSPLNPLPIEPVSINQVPK